MIFDSHAHYHDNRFDSDRDAVLRAMPENGVGYILNCGTELASSRLSISLAEQYPLIYAAVGFHPEDLEGVTEQDAEACFALLSHEKAVAVGEIGLDYYWDASPRDVQKAWFIRQIRLAKSLDMPVVVHDRDAHEDTLTILKEERPKGVLHAFSGSVEMAKEILKLGMYIGLGGVVTFKNARKTVEVAEMIPLDRLLLETDAPYMSPVPYRGQRNDSAKIAFVAEKIAEIRSMSADEVIEVTTGNAKRLFGIA
ncbi:MAG: TatD family hydrolase [Clostridia bacterium]|nr:TatD family hydrolase [Clostridia bacterium]